MDGELQELPNRNRRRAGIQVAMGKGRGIPICLGLLFSCCALSTALLVGLALLLKFGEDPLIDGQVTEKMVIRPGSALYNQLQKPGLPLWKSFYFYNLTNHEQWAAGNELPNVTEVGPYSFSEKRTKYIQSLEGDKLAYNQTKYFYWDGNNSHSNAKRDDIICTINIPLVTAYAKAEDKLLLRTELRILVDALGSQLYICQPAEDLAWHYTDSLVKELHKHHQYPREYVNIQVNGSTNDSAISVINTGANDISLLGNFITWDGHYQNLTTWPRGNANPANRIRGNEGLFFRPLLHEGDGVTAFIDDVQRSFDLVYTGQVKHLSTLAYRFRVVNSTWKNSENPYNANFGSFCPDGLIYLGYTQNPIIAVYGSKPHYLDGDPALRDCCYGMTEPNRTIHDITLDIEPVTGANIQVKQILQVNVQVNKSRHSYFYTSKLKGYNFNDNKTLYHPVLWVSEHAELTPEFQQYLDDQGLTEVEIVREAVPIIFWVLIAFAVLCSLISLASCVGYVFRARRKMAAAEAEETTSLLPPRRY